MIKNNSIEMPTDVRHAVTIIWVITALSAMLAVVEHQLKMISTDYFLSQLVVDALMCIVPYKLSQGSNATRYVYCVLNALAYLMLLGGESGGMTRLEQIYALFSVMPVIYTVRLLFTREANDWFSMVPSSR